MYTRMHTFHVLQGSKIPGDDADFLWRNTLKYVIMEQYLNEADCLAGKPKGGHRPVFKDE